MLHRQFKTQKVLNRTLISKFNVSTICQTMFTIVEDVPNQTMFTIVALWRIAFFFALIFQEQENHSNKTQGTEPSIFTKLHTFPLGS